MATTSRRTFWWHCRRVVRWCRITGLLLALTLLGFLIYLNQVGLPGFVKAALVSELRSRGVELQCERLRLRWYGGLVAENVKLGGSTGPDGPEFAVKEVAIKINLHALLSRRVHVDSLHLLNGRLTLPVNATNEPPRELTAGRIDTVLRFLPGDQWELDRFQATFLGAELHVAASLTNASRLGKLKGPGESRPSGTAVQHLLGPVWRKRLRDFADLVEGMQFSAPPEIRLVAQGDGATPTNFQARLNFHAAQARSQWGAAENLMLTLDWGRLETDSGERQSRLQLELDRLENEWGTASKIQFNATGTAAADKLAPFELSWTASTGPVQSRWFNAPQLKLAGKSRRVDEAGKVWDTDLQLEPGAIDTRWAKGVGEGLGIHGRHNLRRPLECDFVLEAKLRDAKSEWGNAGELAIETRLVHPGRLAASPAKPEWTWWNELKPFDLSWTVRAGQIQARGVEAEDLECVGEWRAPSARLIRLHSRLYGGGLDVAASLDVDSRKVAGRGEFDFNVHKVSHLFGTNGQKWLNQYGWERPPKARGEVEFTLSPWTNRETNWKRDIEPTMSLSGSFEALTSSFRGVPASSARSHLYFTNRIWRLPDLIVTRPEGTVTLDYWCETKSQDYWWKIESGIDPFCLKPLFSGSQRAFDNFQFTTPPRVEGMLWGRWQSPERIGFSSTVAVTNFIVRGETGGEFRAGLEFTNQFLQIRDVDFRRGSESIVVPGAGFDLPASLLYLTNGVSNIDPFVVTRMIGPQTTAAIEPYRFGKPPRVLVNGVVNVKDAHRNDLHFELAGGPFSYWRFNVPEINAATVHWVHDDLTITNVHAAFYGGRLDADFHFDFRPAKGSDFSFHALVADVDSHALMSDLTSPTNKLEGTLEGEVFITAADSTDWKSWQGNGRATLRDGFLWAIPLFGFMSPALDAVMPGLGNSRANAASATFTIKDSVLRTEDLDIHSTAMRLHYEGAVDFDGNVDARVEAQILRDAWLFGRIFGFVLVPLTKLMEYKVTGTLGKPKTELMHIPKILLVPFQPFRALRNIFTDDKKEPSVPPPPQPSPAKPPEP